MPLKFLDADRVTGSTWPTRSAAIYFAVQAWCQGHQRELGWRRRLGPPSTGRHRLRQCPQRRFRDGGGQRRDRTTTRRPETTPPAIRQPNELSVAAVDRNGNGWPASRTTAPRRSSLAAPGVDIISDVPTYDRVRPGFQDLSGDLDVDRLRLRAWPRSCRALNPPVDGRPDRPDRLDATARRRSPSLAGKDHLGGDGRRLQRCCGEPGADRKLAEFGFGRGPFAGLPEPDRPDLSSGRRPSRPGS